MSVLNRSREYLLWFEVHRGRWVAVPVMREGSFIMEQEYDSRVVLSLDGL